MKFHLFMLPTIGRRHELEQGMAGVRDDLYQRMLQEIGEQAPLADEMGFYGLGFTEHHFHIEGFELSTNPVMLDMFVGMQTKNLKVGQLATVLPAHNPLNVAEDVAMLDHMTGGRAYAGFARGYQDRWVNTLGQALGVGATWTTAAPLKSRGISSSWRGPKTHFPTMGTSGRYRRRTPSGIYRRR